MTGELPPTGPAADAAGLEIDGISVRYGDLTVLDGFSLVVEPGEVVAVVGPSGSGKSTLLRAVAGLEPLSGGSIRLAGRELGPVPTHHRGLGLMFQDHGLFTHLDVADNIAYGLRVARTSAGAERRRVAELVALVGLQGLEGRRIDQLSGGEAQRVALARALAPEPRLLMLDEPLGSLDRALREQLTADLRRLLAEVGQTAIHVTHDQSEAFAVADRVAVLCDGRLVAAGRPAELWSDPGSVFVARFLGHPNLWSVTVDDGGEVRASGVPLGRIGTEHRLRRRGPGPVDVVLPATAVVEAGAGDAGLEVEVDGVVFDRGRHRVTARLSAQDRSPTVGTPSRIVIEFDRLAPVAIGQRCRVHLDLDALRPLDDDRATSSARPADD